MTLLPTPSEWSPLEEQFHTWDIVLRNPPIGGVVQSRVLSLWSAISITETHEGIRTSIEINAEEPGVPLIRELVTDFLFYYDRQLLYRLRVVDSEDVLTRDAATVKFDCVSYDKLLERRILHEDWLLDDGDISAAWRLIDYTQRRESLGITRGTPNGGSRRSRALDAGDDILGAINDFAQSEGGFDWWIDQNLKFWAAKPRRGKVLNIQWQLGGEVAEMTRVNPIEDYASLIMATGANSEVRIPRPDGEEDVYPPPNPVVAQLASKPLGLWELTTSDTDVITSGSLLEKAQWHLGDKGSIRPSYKLALEPGVWQPTIGVGDIVQLRINTVRSNVKVPIRIEELSISCTSDGAQTVSLAVRAEQPETPISPIGGPPPLPQLLAAGDPKANGRTVQHHRIDAADDLGALLRAMRKRLDRIERSRGIGGGGGTNILDGHGPPPPTIGSPGDYYVDLDGQQLYGPKEDGAITLHESVTWTTAPANSTRAYEEVSIIGVANADIEIVGYRYGGTPDASDVTITIWDFKTKEVLYTATGPGTGSDGIVEILTPVQIPRTIDYQHNFVVSLGGAAVPVHTPGGAAAYPVGLPNFMSLVSAEGLYSAPLGVREATWQGTVATVDLQLVVRPAGGVVVGDESCAVLDGEPNINVTGEIGHTFYSVWADTIPVRLLGWRYRRLASSDNPMTWRVWRPISRGAVNSTAALGEVLTTVTTTDADAGEYEVRLPTPIALDPVGVSGPYQVMIAAGGDAIPISDVDVGFPVTPEWYSASITPLMNDTIGELPYHGVPGLPGGAFTGAFLVFPIVQEIRDTWPLTNLARSDDPPQQRAEIRRRGDFSAAYSDDDDGVHWYSGGPSHPQYAFPPAKPSTAAGGDGVGSDISDWDVVLRYDGSSGVGLTPNDWYENYYRTPPGDTDARPGYLANRYAYYVWYYDYAFSEQDADLDEFDPYYPDSYYMTFGEQSTAHDVAYWSYSAYGPRHGAVVDDDAPTGARGGAGWGSEVAELTDHTMACNARIWAIADDGIHGTSLQVNPRVIQACFPPDATSDTWWNRGFISEGLTPKGCVSPLITAASATATAADEPWQKQFFRQIGVNDVTFTDGVGVIPVPTAMDLPAVAHAQVQGVTVGGRRVAQCDRTNEYTITVALDTTHSGTLPIYWTVEAAALTFGTPPPSIDVYRDPGSVATYTNQVDYDAAGGPWPFELVSWGNTLVDGCILKDFTGATVGGPFTPETVWLNPDDNGDLTKRHYQQVPWNAERDWYLPGQSQQYRMTNPDGQVSAWNVLNWVDSITFAARQAEPPSRFAAPSGDDRLPPEPNYSNNPKMRPQNNPQSRGVNTAADGKRVGGKQRRQEQKEWMTRQRAMRPDPPDTTAP